MKKVLVATIAMVFFYTGSSFGNDKSIEKLFKVMKIEEQFIGGFDAMFPIIDQMATRFDLKAEARIELEQIYRAWFEEDIDQESVIKKVAEVYASTFTEDEIKEVTRFFQTPVGKKFIEKSPELMKIGAKIGMEEAQSKEKKLLERLGPFFEKYNIK